MFRKLFATILITAVGAGVGFAGAKFQPTQWQASAQFEQPRIAELGNYLTLFATYHLISGNASAADMNKMEANAAEASYTEFKKNIQSPEKLALFLSTTDLVKSQAKLEGLSEQAAIQQLSKHFQFIEGNNQPDTLTITSSSTQEADKLFGEYLRYVNTQTKNTLNNDLIAKWKSLFQQVKAAADAKIDASWENKLKMMASVKPLDDKLVTFRFAKLPAITAIPKPYFEWTLLGAGGGLILGLLLVLIMGSSRKPQD
ncbi:hypothetical protein [Actinobacillus minor]|uniref:hypothetical protein n=1 Tax=Actinobacillus minor TaxID=51047 RepID=UPI0026F31ECE|nr:hypothetical protein [Actinobacillus minor]